MNMILLNGWGMTEEAAARALAVPEQVNLQVVPVTSAWREAVKQSPATVLIGYSTGALLALGAPELLKRFDRVVLFAPFADFKAEAGLGGRVKTVQLKFLQRQLKRDALPALHDFYDRAGLSTPKPTELPLPVDELLWGIERLLTDHADDAWISRAECYVGANDQLLDAAVLAERYPSMRVIENAGHGLAELVSSAGFSL